MADEIYKQIIDRAINEAVAGTVREIIAKNVGSGIDSDIKTMIRDEARRMVKEPEMQDLIRDGLRYWINQQKIR